MEWIILTYKTTKKELLELQIKREEIVEQIEEYEEEVANLFKTQPKRVNINATFDRITFNLTKNRHVSLRYSQLKELSEMFECDDLVIKTPIPCKLEIILLYELKEPEIPDIPEVNPSPEEPPEKKEDLTTFSSINDFEEYIDREM